MCDYVYTRHMNIVYADSINLSDLAPSSITTFGGFTQVIVSNVFVGAGIVSLFIMVFAGFQIISSAGNPKQAEKGKAALTGAVVGLLVVFASFWIVQLIETLSGIKILNSGL